MGNVLRDTHREAMSRENVEIVRQSDHAIHRGVEAISTLFASWCEVYPDVRIVHVEPPLSASDHVLVWARFAGTSVHGMELKWDMAQVFTLENGKIKRAAAFLDRAQALEALWLEE